MKNILIVGMTSIAGGVESFVLNYYRLIDKDKIHFDFLCVSKDKVAYEEELIGKGSKIFYITPKKKQILKYKREISSFFKEKSHKYDVLWVHVNSLANIDFLKLGKKYGIDKRIIHSHNSASMGGVMTTFFHYINKCKIKSYATDFWACSDSAARWFYGSDKRDIVKIIPNAIHVKNYMYNPAKRKYWRETWDLEDYIILGNIGRFHYQKNQEFLLEILQLLIKENDKFRLVLVGEGLDKSKILRKIEELHLEKYVLIVGYQTDISGILSSFDIFLFPSRFEGMPFAVLEAEANGVPILVSNVVPLSMLFNENAMTCSLRSATEIWVSVIMELLNRGRILSFSCIEKQFFKNRFEINNEKRNLENLLLLP